MIDAAPATAAALAAAVAASVPLATFATGYFITSIANTASCIETFAALVTRQVVADVR